MRYVVTKSDDNKLTWGMRKALCKLDFEEELIFPSEEKAVKDVLKRFEEKYFYHIFDLDAWKNKSITIHKDNIEEWSTG